MDGRRSGAETVECRIYGGSVSVVSCKHHLLPVVPIDLVSEIQANEQ